MISAESLPISFIKTMNTFKDVFRILPLSAFEYLVHRLQTFLMCSPGRKRCTQLFTELKINKKYSQVCLRLFNMEISACNRFQISHLTYLCPKIVSV